MSRLVRERAYLSGSLPAIETEVADLRAKLKAARATLKAATDRIQVIDTSIGQLSVIQPSDIRSIRRTPRREGSKHGEFRRELIRVLKEASGPVWTGDLVRHMADAFDLPMDTVEDRDRASYLVRRPLYVFKNKGAVERIPTGTPSSEGLWRWCGD